MKRQIKLFLCAVQFLTRIPVPRLVDFEETWVTRSARYFPLVGQIVGALSAAVLLLASEVWQGYVPLLLALGFGILITGAFHEDGLADTADGLGGGRDAAHRLAIMKDSRIGAYGSMALVCALLLRWALLVALGDRALLAFPLAMALGRWSIVHVLALLPPIAEGLAKEVHRKGTLGLWLGSTACALVLGLLAWRLGLPRVPGAILAAAGASLTWTWRLKVRLGGHSGDCLGATAMLGEAAALLLWVAR